MSTVRILAVLACDWVIAMALFLSARLGSGWFRENLTPNVDLSVTWFALWMVPFLLYAQWRGVGNNLQHGRPLRLIALLGSWQGVILLFGKEIGLVFWFAVMLGSFFVSPFIYPRPVPDDEEYSDEFKFEPR